MGMEEGLTQAVGQIDAILAEDAVAPSRPLTRRATTRPRRTTDDHDTTIEPTTHTLDVPGATLTYDVRRNDASTEPILLLIGSPMGAAGFGTLAGPLHRPHRRHLRPARRRSAASKTDPASPSTPEEHADDLHRIIEALGRAGRPLRQQRRRGQCAGARGEASGGRADARRARAAARLDPARPRGTRSPRPAPSTRRTSARLGRRHGPLHRGGQPPRPVHRGVRRAAGSGSRRCSACRPRTTATRTDPMLGPEHACTSPRTSPTSTPCGGIDPDRRGRRRGVGGRDGESRPAHRRGRAARAASP